MTECLVNSQNADYFRNMTTNTPPLCGNETGAQPDHSFGPCRTAETLLHVARLVHGGQCDASLTPAQWTALRYFASANRFSRTPSAFSEFHVTTRGTASQTVKALIGMGLLERRQHESDGRCSQIELTQAGSEKLSHDPMSDLARVFGELPEDERMAFGQTLRRLSRSLAALRETPVFGKCTDCGHCEERKDETAFCHCTQSLLSEEEMSTLCVDFMPARAG